LVSKLAVQQKTKDTKGRFPEAFSGRTPPTKMILGGVRVLSAKNAELVELFFAILIY